jgi:hypothetical protein
MAYGMGGLPDSYVASFVQADQRLKALLNQGPPRARRFALPYWVVVLAALVLPAAWTWRWHRRVCLGPLMPPMGQQSPGRQDPTHNTPNIQLKQPGNAGWMPRLFTIASTVSMLVFAATVFMWARSDTHRDARRFGWRGQVYALASERGRLGIDTRPQVDDWLANRRREIDELMAERETLLTVWSRTKSQKDFDRQIQFDNRVFAIAGRPAPTTAAYMIRYSIIALLASALPVVWGWQWHQRKRRIAAGECAECGYDLRASKDRCPECGTPIPLKAIA